MNCGGGGCPGLPGWLHKYNTETDGRVCERQLKGKNGDGFILGSMLPKRTEERRVKTPRSQLLSKLGLFFMKYLSFVVLL